MRDYKEETVKRVNYIKDLLKNSGAKGIVYGNSGGKDCTLVAILCKMACDNVIGVMMPCQSKRNYKEDKDDALKAAKESGIKTLTVDLTKVKEVFRAEIDKAEKINDAADSNINPRLRMATLYAIAQTENALVAGTGNRSERFMGYFTKWGDGAFDFNPISDLTVKEVYEFLRYLKAPESIIKKAPSAALFEGQTDEKDMGITYERIDNYLLYDKATTEDKEFLEKTRKRTAHKREKASVYKELND